MTVRIASFEEFRDAIAALRLPLTEDELQTVWSMVQDLYEEADSLRRSLEEMQGVNALTATIDRPGDRRRG